MVTTYPSPSDDDIKKTWLRHLTDERLALELKMVGEEPKGHTLKYREYLMAEAASRLIDHSDKLREVKAAMQKYEEALTARKNGNVAAGVLIDELRPLLKETTTR